MHVNRSVSGSRVVRSGEQQDSSTTTTSWHCNEECVQQSKNHTHDDARSDRPKSKHRSLPCPPARCAPVLSLSALEMVPGSTDAWPSHSAAGSPAAWSARSSSSPNDRSTSRLRSSGLFWDFGTCFANSEARHHKLVSAVTHVLKGVATSLRICCVLCILCCFAFGCYPLSLSLSSKCLDLTLIRKQLFSGRGPFDRNCALPLL